MSIFPKLELELEVQIDDKTRLDGTKSFISKGENPVTLVRIKPEASGTFIDVTGLSSKDWFLDWIYDTGGTKAVSIEITTDTTPTSSPLTVSKDFDTYAVTEVSDHLFSQDQDLEKHEPDILKYVRAGRNSFLDMHRRARDLIINHVDESGWVDSQGLKITLSAFVNIDEVKEWSTALTMRLIFEGLSNKSDDIFGEKAKRYKTLELEHRNKTVLRLDLNGDLAVSRGEFLTVSSPRLVRS